MSLQSVQLAASSSQYLSITDASQTGLDVTGDFTIETSVKFDVAPTSGQLKALVTKDDVGSQRSYALDYYNNSGTLQVRAFISSNGGSSSGSIAEATWNLDLGVGEWKDIALVVDVSEPVASKMTLYVGGASQGTPDATSGSGGSSVHSGSAEFRVGNYGAYSYYPDARFAYVRVFSDARTSSEIEADRNTITVTDANLELEVFFNNSLNDTSPNGNHLTNNNGATFVNDNPLTDISLYGATDYASLTINSSEVDDTLTDFPVYLDLSQIGSSDNFWSTVSSDGSDIRVTDSTGSTQYPVEVVSIDTTGKTGEVHFKIDSLSDTVDTDIRVYYNGTSAARDNDALYGQYEVWSNDYLGVYHLENGDDSTANGNDLSVAGITQTTGQIGDGYTFTGGSDKMERVISMTSLTEVTIQNWIKSTNTGNQISVCYHHSGPDGMEINSLAPNGRLQFASDDGVRANVYPSINLPSTGWRMMHLIQTTTTLKGYVDGGPEGSVSNAYNFGGASSSKFVIGQRPTDVATWSGEIDETRLSSVERTATWISTEYNNQGSPSTFWSYTPSVSTPDSNTILFAFNF